MTTPGSRLSALIDLTADSNSSLADAVRQVKIIATRIGATEIAKWASSELAGYADLEKLPRYRGRRVFPVSGAFAGPSATVALPLSQTGVSLEFFDAHFKASFPHPLKELEALSNAAEEPSSEWDPAVVNEYVRSLGKKGIYYNLTLIHAYMTVPRHTIAGILDSIRSAVLDLALELEQAAPDSGEPGGSTVQNEEVAAATRNFYTFYITGDNTNVATGDFGHQTSSS